MSVEMFGSLMTNLDGGDLAWEFIKRHWDEMISRFPDNTHVRMLAGITSLSTPELARDVEEFFKTHQVKQGQKTLDQQLERLQINVAFRRREPVDHSLVKVGERLCDVLVRPVAPHHALLRLQLFEWHPFPLLG